MPTDESNKLKYNFGIIEFALVVIIGLLGWILIWLNGMDKLYIEMRGQNALLAARVEVLEDANSKGDRFTKADGDIVKKDVQINRDMILQHVQRVEPKIERMYDYIIRNGGNLKP